MKKDIYVELSKIIKKKSFIVFVVLLIGITVLLTIYNNKEVTSEIEYIDIITKDKYPYDDYDMYLKKYNEYNKLYSDDILKSEYVLEHNVNINNKVKSDLSVSNTMVLFLSIYIIILACSSFGGEYDLGTIKLMMLYKSDRRKVVFAKFISLLIISFLLANVIYIFNIITTLLINGNIFNIVELIVKNGNIIEKSILFIHTCEYLRLLIPFIVLISLSLMMGLLMKGSTPASSITIFILLCSSLITELLLHIKFRIIEYSFLPYMDYSIFLNKSSLILYNIENDININVNIGSLIIVIYSLIMLIITISIFKKMEFR